MYKPIIIDNIDTGYSIDEFGNVKNRKGLIMTQYKINSGYMAIKLSINSHKRAFLIHRLVAEAFISKIPYDMVINHIDGDKINNNIKNLEIISFSENIQHGVRNNLFKSGECVYNSKYSNEQIIHVCELLSTGKLSVYDISKQTGVSSKLVSNIKNRRKWKELSKDYNFPKTIPKKNEIVSNKIRNTIIKLIKKGLSSKEIANILSIKFNHTFSNLVYKLKKKCKSSTTKKNTKKGKPLVIEFCIPNDSICRLK